jgi:hypothetical protein
MLKNKDIDLMKIQVLDSSFHSWFTFRASILASGIIGLLILVTTLYYEKIFDALAFYVSLVIIAISMSGVIYFLWKNLGEHLDFMNDLLMKVEKGEQLPPLTELGKIKAKK